MLQMPPPRLIRFALWFGGLAPGLLGILILWSEGPVRSAWLCLLTSAIVLIPMFWRRPSKARKAFVIGSLVYCFGMVAWSWHTVTLGPGPIDDLQKLLLGALCCIVLGSLLLALAVWLRNRAAM